MEAKVFKKGLNSILAAFAKAKLVMRNVLGGLDFSR